MRADLIKTKDVVEGKRSNKAQDQFIWVGAVNPPTKSRMSSEIKNTM